jgi:phosphoesterase RecJ-like protein
MQEKKLSIYKKIFSKISNAKKILIISHRNPDWDTIGSATWLKKIIDSIKSNKQVDIFCVDKIPEKLRFIPLSENYIDTFSYNYDLIIFVDIASKWQTWLEKKYKELFDKKNINTISIDHHISNELFARQNIVIWNYPSTTAIIYEIAKYLNLKIDSFAATSLLTWLLTDTWSLMHSNTNSLAMKYTWELLELWADKDYIINNFFKKNDFLTLKTWWKIFSNSFLDKEILTSYITKLQLKEIWANTENISWALDYLNTCSGIKLSSLLYEKDDYIKGSLRTLNDNVDVSKMAKKFSWGWHKKAAWFTIKWKLEIEKTIVFEEN